MSSENSEYNSEASENNIDHDSIAQPIWDAMNKAISLANKINGAEFTIVHLLHSMYDTHRSMRAIYGVAKKIENKHNEKTSCWADMLVLARSQIDALFIGLFLAHDENKWLPLYYKACWETEARRVIHTVINNGETDSTRKALRKHIYQLKIRARDCSVTTKEWISTMATILKTPYRFGTTKKDIVGSFPTPGKACQNLLNSEYQDISHILYQQWKILCDPSHAGLSILTYRHYLRNEHFGDIGTLQRQKNIQYEFVMRSLFPSFYSILSLITILATKQKSNIELSSEVAKAWDELNIVSPVSKMIWNKWARIALNILN